MRQQAALRKWHSREPCQGKKNDHHHVAYYEHREWTRQCRCFTSSTMRTKRGTAMMQAIRLPHTSWRDLNSVTIELLHNPNFTVLITIQVVYVVRMLRSFTAMHDLRGVTNPKSPISIHSSEQRRHALRANTVDCFLNIILSCVTSILRDRIHVSTPGQMPECDASAIGPS